MSDSSPRIRVLILGGGLGGLSAAWALSHTPALRARYEVSVLSLGWRLGGKVATSQNLARDARFESHGPHTWSGFYDNAFTVARDVLAARAARRGEPPPPLTSVFRKCSYTAIQDTLPDGSPLRWQIRFPENGATPGEGPAPTDPWDLAVHAIQALDHAWRATEGQHPDVPLPAHIDLGDLDEKIARLPWAAGERHRGGLLAGLPLLSSVRPPTAPHALLERLVSLALALSLEIVQQHPLVAGILELLLVSFRELARLALAGLARSHGWAYQTWVSVDLGATAVLGLLRDRVFSLGFDAINNEDFSAWLARHGASPEATASGPVRMLYDFTFGYVDGDPERPSVAAGSTVYGALREIFGYKGAVFWEPLQGLSDAFLTPLFHTLQDRGVRFDFFARIDDLRLSPDRALVREVLLTRQVRLKQEPYDPLVPLGERLVWPSEPRYELIEDGEELRASGINLESHWAPRWKGEHPASLELGRDFDELIVAIPPLAFAPAALELRAASPALDRMFSALGSVATYSAELWLDATTEQLGFEKPPAVKDPVIYSGLPGRFGSWADFSELIPSERWPPGATPLGEQYWSGPWSAPLPPRSDTGFPGRQAALLLEQTRLFLDSSAAIPWSAAMAPQGGFQWPLLHAPDNLQGPARLQVQYLRVNIDPTERYVQSLPGTAAARLDPDGAGFSNLLLAGDWTRNGLDAGSAESAVTSGLLAARCLSGDPFPIVGAPTPRPRPPGARQRVAVLGSGLGSMFTAFLLSSTPELRERYEITVYQMGWRLGGKGASGRNEGHGERIEEHGLHLFLGFYDNAFRLVKQCYDELDRPLGAPQRTWEEAFSPLDWFVTAEQMADGRWERWNVVMPTNHMTPGTGGVLPDLRSYLEMGAELLWILIETLWYEVIGEIGTLIEHLIDGAVGLLLQEIEALLGLDDAPPAPPGGAGTILDALRAQMPRREGEPHGVPLLARAISRAVAALGRLPEVTQGPLLKLLDRALRLLMELAWLALGRAAEDHFLARQLWVTINLGGAILLGLLEDRIPWRGLSVLDDIEFRDWLKRWGANAMTLRSGPVRNVYDGAFAFIHGDWSQGSIAASAALYGFFRTVFTYKGHFFWKMNAGMGDVIFAPLQQLLSRRGVRFEFFHKVEALRLTEDQARVGAIELTRQVKLRHGSYPPLVVVKGLPCWPSEPRYEFIEDGEELRASGIDLESSWAPRWKDATPRRLELGRDFDLVVLGISVAALPAISEDLAAADPAYRAMIHGLATMQTHSVQLWMKPTLEELGWKNQNSQTAQTVLSSYVNPMATYAAMSHLLPAERWAPPQDPRFLAYFTGPFPDAPVIPPPSDHGFPAREKARMTAYARSYLEHLGATWWPDAYAGGAFRWDLLIAPETSQGPQRLEDQFVRVNIDPTERYVLSTPGTRRLRLGPRGTRFTNLFLTGDWIENGFNSGCAEATCISAILTARAVSGVPFELVGP